MKPISFKYLPLILFLSFLIQIPGIASAADDEVQFTFAKPPVTKSIEERESVKRLDLTYLHIDQSNAIIGRGVNFMLKRGYTGGSIGHQWGLFVIEDEDDTLNGGLISYSGTGEIYLGSSKNSVIFFGPSISFLSAEQEMVYTDPYTFQTRKEDFTMLVLNIGIMGGYQHHIPMGKKVVLTPYASLAANYSSFYLEMPYFMDDIEEDSSSTMVTVGFDFLLPGGISVASMFQSGADDDVTLIQAGWNF